LRLFLEVLENLNYCATSSDVALFLGGDCPKTRLMKNSIPNIGMIYPEYENHSRVLIPRFMKYIMQSGGQDPAEISFWTVWRAYVYMQKLIIAKIYRTLYN